MDHIYFWKREEHPHGSLSQWSDSQFVLHGKTFFNAEQRMMLGKAEMTGDTESAEYIMSESGRYPWNSKARGKVVRGFSAATWDEVKVGVAVEANYAKFSQSRYLRHLLLSTGDRTLVEASPYDRVWGIGYRSEQASHNIAAWGLNLLGRCLMIVRERLARERCESAVWTDGSCLNNGTSTANAGIGVFYGDGNPRNARASLTWGKQTNNRAELSAIAYVLCTTNVTQDVTVYTDSHYAIMCITEYSDAWSRNGWRNSRGRTPESLELLLFIRRLIARRRDIGTLTNLEHVKGHSDSIGNREADALAREATASVCTDVRLTRVVLAGAPL